MDTQSNSSKIWDEPIAHITKDGRKHCLYEHLTDTAKMAAKFAAEFGYGEWGYLVGVWHELRRSIRRI